MSHIRNKMMTVGELIEELSKYPKDKEIYILYDGCYIVEPELEILTESDVLGMEDYLHIGDLVIKA